MRGKTRGLNIGKRKSVCEIVRERKEDRTYTTKKVILKVKLHTGRAIGLDGFKDLQF